MHKIKEIQNLLGQTSYIAYTLYVEGLDILYGLMVNIYIFCKPRTRDLCVTLFYTPSVVQIQYSLALYVKYMGAHKIKAVMSWLNWVRVEVVVYALYSHTYRSIYILHSILSWS